MSYAFRRDNNSSSRIFRSHIIPECTIGENLNPSFAVNYSANGKLIDGRGMLLLILTMKVNGILWSQPRVTNTHI